MIIQYGACFGTELAMNNQLATHFRVYFQMPGGQAAALAGCFGLMNLFARSLGGIFSDVMFARYAFPGRLWAQFLSLFFEGVFLCPLARLKRTGYPPDRKIGDFAEIISTFLATPSPLIRQNLRFRRNFVKNFSIP